MSAEKLARAAEALVGTKYRLHGRDPATGLDCIGVLAASLAALGRYPPLPAAYALRSRNPPRADEIAEACGLVRAVEPLRRGDVVLAKVGICQVHLMLAVAPRAFVHAHAGLRKVVQLEGGCEWPVVSHWRLPATIEG